MRIGRAVSRSFEGKQSTCFFPRTRFSPASSASRSPMGGGVMRTAAKAAAVGGYRAAHAPNQGAAAAARLSSRPPTTSVSVPGPAAEGAPQSLSAVSSAHTVPVGAGVAVEKMTSWNIDDWEFAGGKEEELFDAPARQVFGPVPTLEEAKEATSDLKDALDKLYFSPSATGLEGAAVAVRSTSYESGCLENLDAQNRYTAILPSAHRQVFQAFSLLQGSPEAQDVVASLASDKNVWDAVMKNEKVMEFYKTHQINSSPSETIELEEESVIEDVICTAGFSVGEEAPKSSGNGFMDFMHSMKLKVMEMVNTLSDFFKDFMGTTGGGSSASRVANNEGGFVDVAVGGASFLVLAVAIILVILVKRG